MKVEMMEYPKMEEYMGILLMIKMGDTKKKKSVEMFGLNQKIGFAVKIAKTGRNAGAGQKRLIVVENRARVKVFLFCNVIIMNLIFLL